jgi:hypothetical protein
MGKICVPERQNSTQKLQPLKNVLAEAHRPRSVKHIRLSRAMFPGAFKELGRTCGAAVSSCAQIDVQIESMRALQSPHYHYRERRRLSTMQNHAFREHRSKALTPEEDAALRRYLLCDQSGSLMDLEVIEYMLLS